MIERPPGAKNHVRVGNEWIAPPLGRALRTRPRASMAATTPARASAALVPSRGAAAARSRTGRASRLRASVPTMPPVGGAGSSGRARDAPRAAAAASPRSVGISGAPPDLSDASKRALRDEAIAWAAQRGLLVGTDGSDAGSAMCAHLTHAPFAVLPTPFPRDVFDLAADVSPAFAALSDAVSRDDAFLRECLRGVLETDDFTRRVWDVYESCGGQAGRVPVEAGVLRADYMLDAPSGAPLQVEVNTISTSFMALATRVSEMHDHLIRWAPGLEAHYYRGGARPSPDDDSDSDSDDDGSRSRAKKKTTVPSPLPRNGALALAADTLAAAHRAMGVPDARLLMLVQPGETNVMDQRLISRRLFERHGVRTTRATLKEVADRATIGEDAARLIHLDGASHSVAYFRAGYAPGDYPSEAEWAGRLLIERSGAAKSPSAAMHLAGCKKVQQTLAEPGVLERFVDDAETAAKMRGTFAAMRALDGADAAGAVAEALREPDRWVLKPQREGGGNNLYGADLAAALGAFDGDAKPGEEGNLSGYILMRRIFPPANRTLALRRGETSEMETLSELGVYVGYLRVGEEVVMNECGGHLLRTKAATSDEGGVAAGFAVLDSPLLVDE